MNNPRKRILALSIVYFCTIALSGAMQAQQVSGDRPGLQVKKIKDFVIYKDTLFHAAFPSIVQCVDSTYLLAFRRAPERRNYGESGFNHIDPNSYLVSLRSTDGEHWSESPSLLYAHPFGGSQDPCLLRLRDGTILCASYGWAPMSAEALAAIQKPYFEASGSLFLGGYLLRSTDNGEHWEEPIYPPAVPAEINHTLFQRAVPAYNRGALCEGKDGRLFWVIAATDREEPQKTSNHLLVSDDQGRSWEYSCPVATDEEVSFNEASVYETPDGELLAFLRTENFGDTACIARSTDGGKSFQKWQPMGFKGHPLQAHRLPNEQVLLVYGYRHQPFGIRAKLLNASCTDFETAPEIVLRDDGGNGDLGYPWSVQLDEHRVLVVYYYNRQTTDNRHIAGTLLEIK
ncbi:exo-alpha-sialidase [Olivibacter sp. SDN3]|uniref:sialidase family protein n=1 Tax=Olivibacter sp. SDN3 TaxID=2764720 RepID=UPI0016511A67|nr:sialidase family protein [Olivibacter sp. SDN3]QNL51554.1 exo-alpha-sialidase [Olivibacter sp. SDN3]